MPARRVITKRAPFDLDGKLNDYLTNRSLGERSKHHEEQGKKALMEYLEVNGEEDIDGHRTVHLPEPPPFVQYKGGKPVAKVVTAIKRQKRVGRTLDSEKTMALLKEKGLLDQCTEVVLEINEEAVLGAVYTGDITDAEIDALYEERITYAFIMETEDA